MNEEEIMMEIEKIHKSKPLNMYKLEEAIQRYIRPIPKGKRKE